jgi:Flp pilus assembly protein TadG
MLALAALPLFGFVGAAVDFSRAASARTAMQSALDATALMLSKDAPDLNAGDLDQKANDYFKAMFIRPEATNVNGDGTLLKGCATKPTMYYDVQNADQLNNVFTRSRRTLRTSASRTDLSAWRRAPWSPDRHGCRDANECPRILRVT